MRAIFHPNHTCRIGESFSVKDENFHHLKNVIRVREGEEVLILNGEGQRAFSKITKINRRDIELDVESLDSVTDERFLDVAFCLTKKTSFDLAIKVAVELGVRRFIPLMSEFSQSYTFSRSRIDSLVTSAILQSNAAYYLDVVDPIPLTQFVEESADCYKTIHFFDLDKDDMGKSVKNDKKLDLILIGPEGGFSSIERELIRRQENVNSYYLPLNILRASTALPTAVGFILGKQL